MFPLIETLKTPCIATQVWAAQTLGRMGPSAAAAVPYLRKLCRAKSKAVRNAARQAVRQIEAAPTDPSADSPDDSAPNELNGRWARFLRAMRNTLGAAHS